MARTSGGSGRRQIMRLVKRAALVAGSLFALVLAGGAHIKF